MTQTDARKRNTNPAKGSGTDIIQKLRLANNQETGGKEAHAVKHTKQREKGGTKRKIRITGISTRPPDLASKDISETPGHASRD